MTRSAPRMSPGTGGSGTALQIFTAPRTGATLESPEWVGKIKDGNNRPRHRPGVRETRA